jgi:F-type H+-transporting ATPase subunit delta
MKIPREAASTARRAFRMCMDGDRLNDDKLRKVFKKIAASKPRNHQAILHALARLTRIELSSREVVVESSTSLDNATVERVKAGLAAKYGQDLNYEFNVTPDLIGGMRIRVGNDVWDGSVKARLARLTNSF